MHIAYSMSYKFFQNRKCPYFPCHDIDEDRMNCLFCYCPLYALKDKCGGDFIYLKNGIKSCEKCIKPHDGPEAWGYVNGKMKEVMQLAKKK